MSIRWSFFLLQEVIINKDNPTAVSAAPMANNNTVTASILISFIVTAATIKNMFNPILVIS